MAPEKSDKNRGPSQQASSNANVSASVRVLRDGTKLVGANLASTLLSVLISVTLIRLLSKTELVVLPVLQILVALTATVTGLGLPAAAVRLVPQALEREDRSLAVWLMRVTLFSPLVLSVLVCALLYVTAPFVSSLVFKSAEQADIVALVIPALFFGVLVQSLSLMTMAGQRFGVQAIMNIVMRIGQPTVAVGCFVFFGFKGFVLGLAVGPLIAAFVGIVGLRDFFFAKARSQPFGQHLRFSFPYCLNGWVRFASMNADQTIIALLLGPSSLATYYVAKRFAGYIFTLTAAMSSPILPQLARFRANGEDAVARALRTTSRYLFLVLIPVTFGSCSIAFPFITLVAGERYAAAAPIFIVLCLAEIAYAVHGLYAQCVFVLRKPRDMLLLGTSTSALALLGTIGLTTWLGEIGAAVARGVSFGLGAIVGSMIVRRSVPIRPDWRAMRAVTLACLPMVTVVVLAQWSCYSPWLLPCYILLGAVVLLPCHARLWTIKDLRLARDFLPHRAWRALSVLARLAPDKVREEFVQLAPAVEAK